MREVAVIGIGQTKIGELWEKSLRELTTEAVLKTMKDAGRDSVDGLFVGNMMSGTANSQEDLGPLVADWAGVRAEAGSDYLVEAVKVEAACASGGAALRQGYIAVKSGMVDVALVVGGSIVIPHLRHAVETLVLYRPRPVQHQARLPVSTQQLWLFELVPTG